MDETTQNSDVLSAARRFLEDLELFEGRRFLLPSASGEAVQAQAQVRVEADREAEKPAPVAVAPAAKEVELQGRAVLEATAEVLRTRAGIGAAADERAAVSLAAERVQNAEQSADTADRTGELELFRGQICECQNCRLSETRGQFVFGAGRADAGILFVGEAPGADEDRSGQPFVGAAGQLLNKIIAAMGLAREDVYICNILKCRPPDNRDPQPDEIEQCEPYLKRQIELIQPRVICTLGRFAAQTLLRSDQSMGRLRQQEHRYQGIPLIATYHPAALLRNAQWKRPTWEDMKKVRRLYDGVEL